MPVASSITLLLYFSFFFSLSSCFFSRPGQPTQANVPVPLSPHHSPFFLFLSFLLFLFFLFSSYPLILSFPQKTWWRNTGRAADGSDGREAGCARRPVDAGRGGALRRRRGRGRSGAPGRGGGQPGRVRRGQGEEVEGAVQEAVAAAVPCPASCSRAGAGGIDGRGRKRGRGLGRSSRMDEFGGGRGRGNLCRGWRSLTRIEAQPKSRRRGCWPDPRQMIRTARGKDISAYPR